MSKKIFILLGQEDKDTYCGALADAYEKGARAAGHEVERLNIGDMKFDPILHHGYRSIQALEPDLIDLQNKMKWAEHIVMIYPMWWSAMPAILKGLFDRMFIPGFAYHFNHNNMGWHGLLHHKSARIIITMDSWPIIQRFLFGDSTNEISRAILKFAGIHPVHVQKIGPVKDFKDGHKKAWISKVGKWGSKGK